MPESSPENKKMLQEILDAVRNEEHIYPPGRFAHLTQKQREWIATLTDKDIGDITEMLEWWRRWTLFGKTLAIFVAVGGGFIAASLGIIKLIQEIGGAKGLR